LTPLRRAAGDPEGLVGPHLSDQGSSEKGGAAEFDAACGSSARRATCRGQLYRRALTTMSLAAVAVFLLFIIAIGALNLFEFGRVD
jgi:hypothetical protein